jgi:hypothetical protein
MYLLTIKEHIMSLESLGSSCISVGFFKQNCFVVKWSCVNEYFFPRARI